MIKYLLKSISSALGFSKTESQGTLVLIFIIVASILFSRFYVNKLKEHSKTPLDNGLEAWVDEVGSSIEKKQLYSSFEKEVYLPRKDKAPKPYTFAKKDKSEKKKSFSHKSEKIIILDLNSSSAQELQRVRGIGPKLSERM